VNVAARLPELAALHGDRAAFVAGDPDVGESSISFRGLDDATARGAALLSRCGIGPGDRVLLMLPLSVELYVALLSVLRVGASAMLVDPGAGAAHLDAACATAPPATMIGSLKAQLLRIRHPTIRRIPLHLIDGCRWLPSPGSPPGSFVAKRLGVGWRSRDHLSPLTTIQPSEDDDPALITFTSGSTGAAKCAVRSQALLLAQDAALRHALNDPAGSTSLVTLPVFALTNLSGGVTSVLAAGDLRRPADLDPAPLLRQIRRHSIESVVIAPAPLGRLVDAASRDDLASLRRVFTGGGPVFPDFADRVAARLPEARVILLYGSTEAEPIAHVALDEIDDAARSRVIAGAGLPAGAPVDAVTLRVIEDRWGTPLGHLSSEAFDALGRATGTVGELVVSGAHVLGGYLDGIGDEETKFTVDGVRWHRTGDAGHIDAHGHLWLAGRCSARIDDRHGSVYPLQVEAAAHAIARLHRAALLGHAGDRLLFVERQRDAPRTHADLDRIIEALPWAHLARVIPLDRIPMDRRHNSKIDYPALRRLVEG